MIFISNYDFFVYSLIFLVGLSIGSFLNVCIYRIPQNISIIKPRSKCQSCGEKIRFYDNIPILSFIFLKGRCRFCKSKISLIYPIVEFLNGILYCLIVKQFGLGMQSIFLFFFISAMIVIFFIDLKFQIIPNEITLGGIIIGVLYSIVIPTGSVIGSLIGLFMGGGIFFLISMIGGFILKTEVMGGGDIKMMAFVGAFLGWKSVLTTIFIGSLIGSIIGISLILFKKIDKKNKIPFGPFLSIGAIISLFCGNNILNWYLKLIAM